MSAPAGLRYLPGFLSVEERGQLLDALSGLPYRAVVMHGVASKRVTVHYGLDYGYESWELSPAPPLPGFLEPLRSRAASLLAVAPAALEEILVSRYPAGAAIGWHRDAPMFGDVIGVSLGAPATMRFRPRGESRTTWRQPLEPGSAYVLSGEARHRFQHTLSPVKAERYSITFRTVLRKI